MAQLTRVPVPRSPRAYEALVAANANRQSRGMLPSEKMRGPVLWTFPAQRDAMMLFELHDGVRSYRAWPEHAAVRLGDGRDYLPALGATLADGRELVLDIVRYCDEFSAPRRRLDETLASELAGRGIAYLPVTERQAEGDPRLPNAREVLRASGWPVGAREQFDCVGAVRDFGRGATLDALRSAGERGPALAAAACVLSMRRVLAIDLRAPVPGGCRVHVPVRSAV